VAAQRCWAAEAASGAAAHHRPQVGRRPPHRLHQQARCPPCDARKEAWQPSMTLLLLLLPPLRLGLLRLGLRCQRMGAAGI